MNNIVEWIHWPLLVRVCDVLLVSYLFYRILLFVRGTRALPMLYGLLVILTIYAASRWLNLVTLNWIFGNFLGSLILIVVVLFQDDLRRALTKVGLFPGFGHAPTEVVENAIRDIARAASELASRRLGGLIVLARDVGLDDYTEHAVPINGMISHELLTSIFLPTSPLHDGAVVIKGNRILVAGAVLPLSFNPSISSAYGTRHRAAVGLSERTDAVVVVVSEETGVISLIREGRITKALNETTLYNALHRLTIFRQQKRASRSLALFWKRRGRKKASEKGAEPTEPSK